MTPPDNRFIDVFQFKKDKSKPGRTLWSVEIGDVYMSRLIIDPGVTTGNYYHKNTRLMFYVGGGEVRSVFEHVQTKERKDMIVSYPNEVIHVPPYVALATKNIGHEQAIIVFFSDRPIRDKGDCYEYEVQS
jgi:dTDP-4-dehydrorhamnose 3,5-epimerase-like enzyme